MPVVTATIDDCATIVENFLERFFLKWRRRLKPLFNLSTGNIGKDRDLRHPGKIIRHQRDEFLRQFA